MKPIACILALLLSPLYLAHAEVQSGTVIVVYFSQDKLIMAADSRSGFTDRANSDEICKIIAPNHKFLFAVAGIAAATDKTNSFLTWDGQDEARRAYDKTIGAFSEAPPDLIERIATSWGQTIQQNIVRLYFSDIATFKSRLKQPKGMLSLGVFGGRNPNGSLRLITAEIDYDESFLPPIRLTVTTQSCVENVNICAFGEVSVPAEYVNLVSDRAKKERAGWDPSPAFPKEDWDILRVIRLVDLTIAFDKTGRVGGGIDAAQISQDGTLRWYQRKENCRED